MRRAEGNFRIRPDARFGDVFKERDARAYEGLAALPDAREVEKALRNAEDNFAEVYALQQEVGLIDAPSLEAKVWTTAEQLDSAIDRLTTIASSVAPHEPRRTILL